MEENINPNETPAAKVIRDIEYGSVQISQLRITQRDKDGNPTLISINDEIEAQPTPRFWNSLTSNFAQYGLSQKLFKLFDEHEVFERLTTRLAGKAEDRVRYAIEHHGGDVAPRLLATSLPHKPRIDYRNALNIVAPHALSVAGVTYSDGIVQSTHQPAHMADFEVGGDKFSYRYVTETPIDGFGKPLIYLSLLRLVCTNGVIAYARAFKSEVQLGGSDGSDASFSLRRTLDTFNNEEGYDALRHRMDAATNSWASIADASSLATLIKRLADSHSFVRPDIDGSIKSLAFRETVGHRLSELDTSKQDTVRDEITRAYRALTGDIVNHYGISSLDVLSRKRQAALPVRCSVYDLINFATELASHWANNVNAASRLHAWVGTAISAEYDLEGSRETYGQFTDWFLADTAKKQ